MLLIIHQSHPQVAAARWPRLGDRGSVTAARWPRLGNVVACGGMGVPNREKRPTRVTHLGRALMPTLPWTLCHHAQGMPVGIPAWQAKRLLHGARQTTSSANLATAALTAVGGLV